jgi:ribonuclease G
MTVIDVNTGRFVGKRDLEDTIVRTNLEAVKEIAYQIKLRSIGGIIIIDFIDMERERNREKVFQALNDVLAHDKARTRVLRVSELGVVEMSRERVREDIYRALSEPCQYCEGRAYTKDPTTVCYELFRDIRRVGPAPDEAVVVIGAHPSVATVLGDEEAASVAELERDCRIKMIIKPDPRLHIEQYDIVMF